MSIKLRNNPAALTAYIAAMVDGEGCIGFSRTGKLLYPRVMIANTCLKLLEFIQSECGGRINEQRHRKQAWKRVL